MSRSPRTSAFFGFLSPWGLGQQLSPVALLSFINIENLYPFPVAIKSYAMSIRSGSCGWTHLAPIDSRSGKLLFLHAPQSPDKADAVLDTSNALDRDLRNPIAEHDSREGVLLFDTPSRCEAKVGDVVKLRLEIKDSDGAVFSYESSDLLILPGPTSKGTARRTTNFAVTVTGVFLDTSRVIRRNYSDPAPPYMNMDQFRNDVAVPIRVTSSFSLSFPDGTYIGSRP
jgi:hypothetical protein